MTTDAQREKQERDDNAITREAQRAWDMLEKRREEKRKEADAKEEAARKEAIKAAQLKAKAKSDLKARTMEKKTGPKKDPAYVMGTLEWYERLKKEKENKS